MRKMTVFSILCKGNPVLQINTKLRSEMANSEDLEQLISITGAERNVAENLLEACGGDGWSINPTCLIVYCPR